MLSGRCINENVKNMVRIQKEVENQKGKGLKNITYEENLNDFQVLIKKKKEGK